jgi:hypothetical protein
MQVCVAAAAVFSSHVAPDRKEKVVCDRRCPKRSGSGRSLCREQSRRGASRIGSSTPGPAHLRRLPPIWRETSGTDQAAVPTTDSGGSGCSSGPRSCSWERSSAEVVRAHAAWKRKRRASVEGSSRCSRTSMNTCGGCLAGQRAQRSTRASRKRGPCWSRAMEGTSIPERSARIDVRRLERGHSTGNWALRVPFQTRVRGVRGSARRSDRQPTRLRRSLHTA